MEYIYPFPPIFSIYRYVNFKATFLLCTKNLLTTNLLSTMNPCSFNPFRYQQKTDTWKIKGLTRFKVSTYLVSIKFKIVEDCR